MSNQVLSDMFRRLGGPDSTVLADELERVQRRSSSRLGRGIRRQMVVRMVASADSRQFQGGTKRS